MAINMNRLITCCSKSQDSNKSIKSSCIGIITVIGIYFKITKVEDVYSVQQDFLWQPSIC